MVELALVAPVVLALLLGTFEAGWYLYSYLSVEQLTREGSRALSVHGTAPDGDEIVLGTVLQQLGANKASTIERVILYHASDTSQPPPERCYAATAPGSDEGQCTVYTSADLDRDAGSLACSWCSDERSAGELVGLAVRLRYTSPTGLLGDRFIDRSTVLHLEIPS